MFRGKHRVVAVGMILLTLLGLSVAYAAPSNIETWDIGEQNLEVQSTAPVDDDIIDTVSSIGGERDIRLQYSSGTGGVIQCNVDFGSITEPPGSNRVSYNAGEEMKGTLTLQWDGDDDSLSLDYDGLGGVDLTDGSASDSIHVVILAEDLRGALTFEIYEYNTSGASWCESTVDLVGINPGTRADVVFPFSGFTRGGGSGSCVPVAGSAGAVVMFVDGTVEQGLDLSIDFAQTDSVREYGDLPLGTYSATILEANHIPQGLRLGDDCDAESTYASSTYADGDDISTSVDDEDGVMYDLGLWDFDGDVGQVGITVDGCLGPGTPPRCRVSGWVDWDNDGSFDDALEQIFADRLQADGYTDYYFSIPDGLSNGYYYSRFRVCVNIDECDDPDTTDTNVLNGEVEDYWWPLGPTAVALASFDATWRGEEVVVEWETASELDTVGFNLWRGTVAEDSFLQVNDRLIASPSPGGPLGARYSYRDADVTRGMGYSYKLEEVQAGGGSAWYGPVEAMFKIYLPLVVGP